jgi:hypothetical protein
MESNGKPMKHYSFEMTDTFGGETNYSWVKRFKIDARSFRGAMIKFGKINGHANWRLTRDESYSRQYDSGCVRLFVEEGGDEN